MIRPNKVAFWSAVALSALCISFSASAQTPSPSSIPLVVPSCGGTQVFVGASGLSRSPTVDTYGNQCTAAAAPPSGGATSANQTNVQSAPGTSASTASAVQGVTGGVPVGAAEQGSSSSAIGITPTTANASTGINLKASPGNLYGVYAVNQTATAGWLIIYNATAVPATGALTASLVLDCIPLNGNGSATLNYGAGPPKNYSVGISAIVSSGSCTTYTTGTITAYISGIVR